MCYADGTPTTERLSCLFMKNTLTVTYRKSFLIKDCEDLGCRIIVKVIEIFVRFDKKKNICFF